MKKATKLLEYNVIFREEKEGGYSAYVPDLPGCHSQGDTFEETKKNIKEAIELYLEETNSEIYQTTPDIVRNQFMAPIQISL